MGKKGGLFRYADAADKFLMLSGILGSLGDGLMTPLTMIVLSGVVNEYGNADISFSNHVIDKYALRLLYVAIGVGFCAFVEGLCWTRTAERQTSRMRMEYLKSVLRQEVSFFDSQATSSSTFQVISTISSDGHLIQGAIAEKIPNCLANLSTFIFSLMVAFLLSWRLALAALPFSFMFVVPGVVLGKSLMNVGMKIKEAYSIAGGIAEQAISSVRIVYSFVGEQDTLDKFSHALEKSMRLGVKRGLMKGLLIGSMGMIFAVWGFQAWVGSVLVTEKGEKGAPVFIAGICTVLGGLAIMNALPNISFISDAKVAAIRIFETIDRIPIIDCEDEGGKVLAFVKGDIEFKDVTFCYPSRPETLILQRFNLKVQAGVTIGLVGASGSGKSTVISLLERFYDPTEGNIFLDGLEIKNLQLEWLRSQMGLVNQEPILFATSIKENILFGKEGADVELVVKAAKAANAHDFIVKLPEGYDTHVGQLGVQLSGGQKQRIAIARALIRDPRILLLDEATSALDAESERIVQEALDKASVGRTTIIIAHRLSTIRGANTIVVLSSGRVVESGSHDELIRKSNGEGGAYFKMVQLQQSTTQGEGSMSNLSNPTRSAKTAGTPNHRRRNWHSSPALSISMTHSFESHPYDDDDDDGYDDAEKEGTVKDSKSSDRSASQWHLLRMSLPEWKRTVLGCFGAVSYGAIQPVYSYCLGTVVSVYFLKDNSTIKSETKFYSIIFVILAVLSFFTNLLQHYSFAVMGERLTKRLRERMLAKVLTFEVGWFDREKNTSATVCAQLDTEASAVRSLMAERMQLVIQVSVSASLAYLLALVVTWKLSIVMIAMQPLIIGCFYSRIVLMKSMSKKAEKAQQEGSQLASEAVVNHRTITAFSSQKRMLRLFGSAMDAPRKESVRQSWFSGFGLFSSQFITTASIALTYWYGGRLMTQGHLTPKHLFQVFFILMSTGKNIADTGAMTSDLNKGKGAVRSVFAILNRKSEIEPEDSEGIGTENVINGDLMLNNVFFAYPARPDQMIFKGLTLKIEAGKRIALVGQSGSGKSTIIGLIERFYDPLKGSVEIDNCDIRKYNLRKLRSHIALVSQEPTLFAGTIRENIMFGKENATETELRKAALLANADEFISSMKDGYNTYCGERGVQLSGGQKQRVALARAILKNPTILLLDEATSALDSVSEKLVQDALEKMMVGRTCVVVAHRLSTVQTSDSIAVLKNGKLVEKGSHYDLLDRGEGGAYYSLVKLQAGNTHTNEPLQR